MIDSDITSFVKKLKENTSSSIRVCMPGKVDKYDFKTQKASIKIDMKEKYSDGTEVDYPIVTNVPVVFMASGGASITMPVLQGDPCIVIFADRDISSWLLGGSGQSPEKTRFHDLSDAIAIVGLMQFTSESKAQNNTDVLITYDNSNIILKPGGIIDIITSKEVNVKTDKVTINCVNALVNAKEDIKANCNNLVVGVAELAEVKCNNATITTTQDIKATCANIFVTASEASEIKANTASLVIADSITAKCATGTVECTGALDITCGSASITSNGDIDTQGGTFTHTGNLVITGTINVNGTSKFDQQVTITGGLANTGGVLKSNGITLETHTHTYDRAVDGSSPTVVVPAITGTPT